MFYDGLPKSRHGGVSRNGQVGFGQVLQNIGEDLKRNILHVGIQVTEKRTEEQIEGKLW